MKISPTLVAGIVILLNAYGLFGQTLKMQKVREDKNGSIAFAKFNSESTEKMLAEGELFLAHVLQTQDETSFQLMRSKTDKYGNTHKKYQQYYRGFKVVGAEYALHGKEGYVISMNGKYVKIQIDNTDPAISESDALNEALATIAANKYKWEKDGDEDTNGYPKGELVIAMDVFGKSEEWKLAWKFKITALDPYSAENIYIDAHDGQILNRVSLICSTNSTGSAQTRYSGTRTITTDSFVGGFRLRETRNGVNVRTMNMQEGTNYSNSIDFVDNNNNWTSTEHDNADEDQVALDAHWGAEQVLDYWDEVHGRNSIDNNGLDVISYVHFEEEWDNAQWDGDSLVMRYGDGTSYDPLTTLDICAHEFGHGIDQFESNLTYQYEYGALDESLSDIWGAVIENWAASEKNHWLIGEEIGTLRSMSNPKGYNQPNTYEGLNWFDISGCTPHPTQNDFCGVHTNSGVMNYWFYLLSEGKSQTNDNNDPFVVSGIGIEDAAEIVYQAETNYLLSTSDYEDARDAMVMAAEDIFGDCSTEYIQVTNAWHAVGIGNATGTVGGKYTVGAATYYASGSVGIGLSGSSASTYITLMTYGSSSVYDWEVLSQSGSVSKTFNGRQADITLGAGAHCNVKCTVDTSCGEYSMTFYIYNYSSFSFVVYPNPASGTLKVSAKEVTPGYDDMPLTSMTSFASQSDQVQVQDLAGVNLKLLSETGETVASGEFKDKGCLLDIQNIPAGQYFLHVETEKEKIIKHILIEH